MEDGIVDGGFGWAVRELLVDQGKRVLCAGVPKAFLAHGERPEILSDLGLDATGIEARILEACAGSASR